MKCHAVSFESVLVQVKSLNLLQETQCVVYDDLASQEGLSHCKPDTDVVYVGKRGATGFKQADICKLLVRKCQEYDHVRLCCPRDMDCSKTTLRSACCHTEWCQRAGCTQVVRLKGGCVSIFSRASEEIAALREHGIDYELVPGVSSALAAPALAGFPLTDKALSTSTAVLSAHSPDSIRWAALRSAVDTVVLLMTGKTFVAVLAGALGAGWPPETPVRNCPEGLIRLRLL
jgi:siroheme synthase